MNTRSIIIRSLDQRLPSLASARVAATRPVHGWLRTLRQALGLPQSTLAQRLKVTRAAVSQFESAEKRQAITLASLERSADALGCDLVYFLVPRGGKSFSELAADNDPHEQHLRATEHSMSLENQSVPRPSQGSMG